jgi:hypothetical protein
MCAGLKFLSLQHATGYYEIFAADRTAGSTALALKKKDLNLI